MHQTAELTNQNKQLPDKDKNNGLSTASILLVGEESEDASTAVTGLFYLLKNINVTPECIIQNQWKSAKKNGEVEFYY